MDKIGGPVNIKLIWVGCEGQGCGVCGGLLRYTNTNNIQHP